MFSFSFFIVLPRQPSSSLSYLLVLSKTWKDKISSIKLIINQQTNIEDKTCTNENDSNHTYKSIRPKLILFYLCASVIPFSPFRYFVIFTLFSTFIVPPHFPRPPKCMLFIKPREKKKIITRTIKSTFEIKKPKTQSKDLVTKIFLSKGLVFKFFR